ncbi:hypothetical protein FIBSPDRAFT_968438 [Athelia psychrophila]|uniref:Uncharacterized protein n=1 Tax=Athelia psychrophila TaxID=1759441 RepID=A0A167ULY1_9AGAM|nr:hypothetical protein FIBSPDRAFT_968438 [Fibularhizoctonia sp. CBS 109695]
MYDCSSATAVGADRDAKKADKANKPATTSPSLAVAPISTVNLDVPSGSHIPIEHRPPLEACLVRGAIYPTEITDQGEKKQAVVMVTPEGLKPEGVYNPSFDVTPADLISAIVTEKGVATRGKGQLVFDLSGVV